MPSAVDMRLKREFERGTKGRIAGVVNHGFGDRWRRMGWSRMLNQVLRKVEEGGSAAAHSA